MYWPQTRSSSHCEGFSDVNTSYDANVAEPMWALCTGMGLIPSAPPLVPRATVPFISLSVIPTVAPPSAGENTRLRLECHDLEENLKGRGVLPAHWLRRPNERSICDLACLPEVTHSPYRPFNWLISDLECKGSEEMWVDKVKEWNRSLEKDVDGF